MGKRIIGVTGGLAAGKTTVSSLLADKGALLIDADGISHDLLDKDADVIQKVVSAFGEDILTEGKVDRRKLAGQVFFDREKLEKLCGILHPGIIREIKDRVERSESDVVVIDAPLLLEAGLGEYVDEVVVVTATEDIQVRRAKERGIKEEEARCIISKQMPVSEKVKSADHVIDNGSDIEKIKEGVEKIWQRT
ncbi:MAG: dephospho-CoA kinase [Candidatus Tantalella remota]|nr:dephospho-CoA kinase [Candidatus Tantalella remota]